MVVFIDNLKTMNINGLNKFCLGIKALLMLRGVFFVSLIHVMRAYLTDTTYKADLLPDGMGVALDTHKLITMTDTAAGYQVLPSMD